MVATMIVLNVGKASVVVDDGEVRNNPRGKNGFLHFIYAAPVLGACPAFSIMSGITFHGCGVEFPGFRVGRRSQTTQARSKIRPSFPPDRRVTAGIFAGQDF